VHNFELELCVGCSIRLVILISDPGSISRRMSHRLAFKAHFSPFFPWHSLLCTI